MGKRIAKGTYTEEAPAVASLSSKDYDAMVVEIKAKIGKDTVMDIDALEGYILVTQGYASGKGATGADVEKAIKELCQKVIDSPAEYDKEGNIVTEEQSHYDYKLSSGLFVQVVEEEL